MHNLSGTFLHVFFLICLFVFPQVSFSQHLASEIPTGKKYWLGISYKLPTDISSTNSQNNIKKGLLVEYVYPYGPAFIGGIKEEDLIVEVNGIQVSEINDFSLFLKNVPEKENVVFKIIRKDSTQFFSISLEIYDKDKYFKKIDAIRSGKLTEGNRLQVAIFYAKSNMLSTAEEELNRVLEINKNNAIAHLWLGKSYSSQKEYGQAIEAFKKSIAIQPHLEEALDQLGFTYILVNKYEKAVEPFKKLIAVNPRHFYAHNSLGHLYARGGDYDAALKEFDDALKIDPKNYYAKFEIARMQNAMGEYQKAYEGLIKIINLHPNDVATLVETAHSLKGMGKLEMVAEIYGRLVGLKPNPNDVAALAETALALKDIGKLEKAAKIYERLVELKPTNDYYFYELGYIYDKLKKLDKAITNLTRAVELNPNDAGYRYSLAGSYFSLAGNYNEKGESEKAIQEFQKIVAINLKDSDSDILADTFNALGNLYSFKHDLESALKYFKKAISLKPKSPFNHINIADLYFRLVQISEAEKHFNIAIELDPEYSRSYINLGDFYRKTGELNKAIISFHKALQILQADENRDDSSYVYTLRLMAEAYEGLRNFSEAENYLKKAVEYQRDLFGVKSVEYLKAYSDLGSFYAQNLKIEEALAVFSRALALKSEMRGKNNAFYADTLLDLGALAILQGKYDTAESYLIDSLRINENISDKSKTSFARVYSALGFFYSLIKSYDKTEKYFSKYSMIVKNELGEDSLAYASSLSALASVSGYKNDFARAFELSEEVANIYIKLGDTSGMGYVSASMNMAQNSLLLGNIEKAKNISEKFLNHPDKSIRAQALAILAMINASLNNFYAAESQYEAALQLLKEYMGNDTSYANGLMYLAALKAKNGEHQIAWELAQSAKLIISDQLNRIFSFASENDKFNYVVGLSTIFYDLNMSLGLNVLDKKNTAEVLLVDVLNYKNIILDSLIRQNEVVKNNPQLKPLHKDLSNLKQKYSSLKLRSSLLGGSAVLKNISDQEKYFDELNKNIEELESRITRISSKSKDNTAIKNVDLPSLQASLSKGSVLVEFAKINITTHAEKTNYLAFVLNKEKFGPASIINLGDSKLIDSAILEFRKSIQAKRDEAVVKKFGNKLYRLLIEPLLPQINNPDHIFISPDSDISFLPFDALVDDGGEYLISKFKFSYLNNGKDIIRFDGRNSNHNQKVILVGNPSFDNFAYTIPPDSTVQNQEIPKTRSADYKKLSFGSLPGTKHEIDAIGEIIKNVEPVIYANENANELNIKSISSPWILHIATHGFFLGNKSPDKSVSSNRGFSIVPLTQADLLPNITIDIKNPLLSSGLALAGVNKFLQGGIGGNGDDGLLVAMEVLGMNLTNTDLVVLSACDTGVGEIKRGHGVFGLRRAFQQAGAKSLVTSLWQIPDRETKDLMVEFYKRLYDGKSKLNALHEASLSVMKSAKDKHKSTHPFYWGGFILIGDPGSN
jgi:tetratricopeptide (TPR) repeat protein